MSDELEALEALLNRDGDAPEAPAARDEPRRGPERPRATAPPISSGGWCWL